MKKYYIAIDIGGTNTKVALVTKRFDILNKRSLSTPSYKTPRRLISAIKDSAFLMFAARGARLPQISGAGVGVAGLVDAAKGLIYNLTNIPGWKGLNIKELLGKALAVPVYADNDANAMALAELYKGAGAGCGNIVCLTLGTGIGGGIVIDGKLYRGSSFSAGEIGHIPINENGPACNCGGCACVEVYTGAGHLNGELRRLVSGKKSAFLKKMCGGKLSALTLEMACEAAMLGDRAVIDLWKRAGRRIGIMLAGVINLLDPEKIIIGGGVAGAGRYIFEPIRKTVRERAMMVRHRRIRIVKAKLGADAGLVGAAILAHLGKKDR